MGCTFNAVLNKDNRKNKTGRYTIFIRITVDRQTKYFSIGERIDQRYWTGRVNHWVKANHPGAFELNKMIRDKIELLYQFYFRQRAFGNGVSMQSLSAFFHKKIDPNVFNEYVAQYIKTVRGKSLNTLKKYRTFEKYLNEFNPKITFASLNEHLFQQFAAWLKKKGLMGVTVYKYFDPFKVICIQAVKDGYLDRNPFDHVRLGVKATRGSRVYLEVEEISKLKNAILPADRPDLERVRDYWMFCFYAGFYYSDLCKLRWENVKNTDSGYVIIASRHKNDNSYIAPIHKFQSALEILEGQRGKDSVLVFPEAISEQKYNQKLKELAAAAGIQKKLMNKTARHSAIQFWEAQGLETQHVSKIAGHSKESTTKHYFDLSTRDINNRVKKLDFSGYDI
jgi:integrase